MPRQTLVRFVVITRFQVASSISSTTPPIAWAALLTRMSIVAEALDRRRPASASMSAIDVTSVLTKTAVPPAPVISSRVASPAFGVDVGDDDPRAVFAPSACAQDRPIPIAAPVMIATRPSRSPALMVIRP